MKRSSLGGTKISPQKKKRRSSGRAVVLNSFAVAPVYVAEKKKNELNKAFYQKKDTPFPHFQMSGFVDPDQAELVKKVENELRNLGSWHRKENDLYSLHQTKDFVTLDAVKYPSLYSFRQFLYTKVREWLATTLDVELTTEVDSNGSCYRHTDSLLPHNDLIDTRHFAFVYYLTKPDWNLEESGGALQLYNSNEEGQATSVFKELTPERNSLVIFEVSQKSWHRVAEVTSDEERLSINGWFHSKRRLTAEPAKVESLPRYLPSKRFDLGEIVQNTYLNEECQSKVQSSFADDSEISLNSFLKDDVHKKLFDELSAHSKNFSVVGPPSKRHIARLDQNVKSLKITQKVIDMFKSTSFRDLAGKLSGIVLDGAKMSVKVHRVEEGSYWVLGDEDAAATESEGYCLDLHFFAHFGEWPETAGGELIYIAEGEDEELISIGPQENTLAMVFREPGVMSFLKYANSTAQNSYFLISATYYDVSVVEQEPEPVPEVEKKNKKKKNKKNKAKKMD